MGWIAFEVTIDLLEMFTSFFFAAGIFRKDLRERRDVFVLVLFSICAAIFMSLREYVFVWIPDFTSAVIFFAMYAMIICHAKWWAAVSWALTNYLLIGIVSITGTYSLESIISMSIESMELGGSRRVIACILTRLGQLLLSELILVMIRRFSGAVTVRRGSLKIIAASSVSIVVLWSIWLLRLHGDDNFVGYFILLICVLILVINYALLFFDETLARERRRGEELKTQNRLMALQMRSQDEMNNMYRNMLALKHDMNNHLHTISGYMQIGEYGRAQEYIGKIIGEVSGTESLHSGNAVLDVLIGSKTALAKMNGIPVELDMVVPPGLKIDDGHLAVVIGNLYDNAMDANLQIRDAAKRFIHIKILYGGENLLILFENAAPQEENKSGSSQTWATTKEDSSLHGFGIKNIDSIVHIYGGYCERELEDQVFRCRIRMPDINVGHTPGRSMISGKEKSWRDENSDL